MNQRHPQSRHTPHGGSEKTDTEKGTRARKRKRAQGGLGQWLTGATAGHVCPLPPLSPAAWFLPPVSSPPPLVPRIPHPKFVPRGVGAGRAVCWVLRAQVPRLGGLVGDALEAGWRRASACAHGNGYTGFFLIAPARLPDAGVGGLGDFVYVESVRRDS